MDLNLKTKVIAQKSAKGAIHQFGVRLGSQMIDVGIGPRLRTQVTTSRLPPLPNKLVYKEQESILIAGKKHSVILQSYMMICLTHLSLNISMFPLLCQQLGNFCSGTDGEWPIWNQHYWEYKSSSYKCKLFNLSVFSFSKESSGFKSVKHFIEFYLRWNDREGSIHQMSDDDRAEFPTRKAL